MTDYRNDGPFDNLPEEPLDLVTGLAAKIKKKRDNLTASLVKELAALQKAEDRMRRAFSKWDACRWSVKRHERQLDRLDIELRNAEQSS